MKKALVVGLALGFVVAVFIATGFPQDKTLARKKSVIEKVKLGQPSSPETREFKHLERLIEWFGIANHGQSLELLKAKEVMRTISEYEAVKELYEPLSEIDDEAQSLIDAVIAKIHELEEDLVELAVKNNPKGALTEDDMKELKEFGDKLTRDQTDLARRLHKVYDTLLFEQSFVK